MPRRLPSLNALKAFEAAARHESFTRAAEELCVSQGAVSHQVKALEAELGCRLFNREHRRLVITSAGLAYLVVVGEAFAPPLFTQLAKLTMPRGWVTMRNSPPGGFRGAGARCGAASNACAPSTPPP